MPFYSILASATRIFRFAEEVQFTTMHPQTTRKVYARTTSFLQSCEIDCRSGYSWERILVSILLPFSSVFWVVVRILFTGVGVQAKAREGLLLTSEPCHFCMYTRDYTPGSRALAYPQAAVLPHSHGRLHAELSQQPTLSSRHQTTPPPYLLNDPIQGIPPTRYI